MTTSVLEQLLKRRLADDGVHVEDHPEPGAPLRAQLVFGARVETDLGAIYYTDAGGAWFSRGTAARADGDELYLAELDFPLDSEIPVPQLRKALLEYEQTRQRPTGVDWQPAE
ncbi:Imm1 family immunity protein [Allokutzneria albata]|uniref:Immunity protein Imm1 n=1 Tax=Allokutzneria albata TaxID=211114 RepID=A0A1G9S9B6_ALLAB|nr:Imm1 family immunity protein [Allokutzneria albata]SDM31992.1 Immunity protein Imm1 [Allokutzneria albata]